MKGRFFNDSLDQNDDLKVVINEAILMTTEFGAEGGHTFVNGVLTKVAANIRQVEMDL